jgi:hypothetical protein
MRLLRRFGRMTPDSERAEACLRGLVMRNGLESGFLFGAGTADSSRDADLSFLIRTNFPIADHTAGISEPREATRATLVAIHLLVYDGDVEEGICHQFDEIGGVRTLDCFPDGKKIQTDRDAVELIGVALQHRAQIVVIPVERFAPEFFSLRTGIAGGIVQKFVQYRRRLVILGDMAPYLAVSSAFAAFVTEANRGRDIWFLPDRSALEERLEKHEET